MEDLLQGYTEDVRDAESDFERGRVLVALDGVDGIAVTQKQHQRRNATACNDWIEEGPWFGKGLFCLRRVS